LNDTEAKKCPRYNKECLGRTYWNWCWH